MPIYEYECSKCKNIFEDWCKSVADGDKEHFCPECNAPAARIISHTSFALKGDGWYATEYGNLKNKNDSKNTVTSSDNSTKSDTSTSTKDSTVTKAETSAPKQNDTSAKKADVSTPKKTSASS